MNKERIKKLESVAQALITRFIFEELEDSADFWLITVTEIKVSSDISYLDVFVSSIKNSEILTKTLAKHTHEIQKKFNKSISIRKLPRIRFRYDDRWAIWEEVCKTINSLNI